MLSGVQSVWREEIERSYQNDNRAQDFITAVTVNPTAHPDYSLVAGVFKFKGKVYVGKTTALRQQIL